MKYGAISKNSSARSYKPVETYKTEGADTLLITMGFHR